MRLRAVELTFLVSRLLFILLCLQDQTTVKATVRKRQNPGQWEGHLYLLVIGSHWGWWDEGCNPTLQEFHPSESQYCIWTHTKAIVRAKCHCPFQHPSSYPLPCDTTESCRFAHWVGRFDRFDLVVHKTSFVLTSSLFILRHYLRRHKQCPAINYSQVHRQGVWPLKWSDRRSPLNVVPRCATLWMLCHISVLVVQCGSYRELLNFLAQF